MYGDAHPVPVYSRYVVLTAGGAQAEYPFRWAFPTEPRVIAVRLDALIRRCNCRRYDVKTDRLLQALAEIYAARHKVAVHGIDVYSVVFSLNGYPDQSVLTYQWRTLDR